MFDAGPITIRSVSQIEVASSEYSLDLLDVIDRKIGVVNVVFVTKVAQENLAESRGMRRKEIDMQKPVHCGVDRDVQSILSVPDSTHAFSNGDLIQ